MLCRSPDGLANSTLLEGRSLARQSGSAESDSNGQGSIRRFPCPQVRAPTWKAGFVSKSDSYKAWIGAEEAEQTGEELTQRQ